MNDFEIDSSVIDVDAEWNALMGDLFGEDYSTESNGWETF